MCRFVLGSVKTEGGVGLANRYKSLLGDSGNDSPVVVVAVCRRRGANCSHHFTNKFSTYEKTGSELQVLTPLSSSYIQLSGYFSSFVKYPHYSYSYIRYYITVCCVT